MDPLFRDELAELYKADDAARADFEAWQQRQHDRDRDSARSRKIYKTFGDDEVRQRLSTPTMTPQQQEPWDAWCNARIDARIDEVYINSIAQFVSEYVSKRLKKEVRKLRKEIDQLRAEVTTATTTRRAKASR